MKKIKILLNFFVYALFVATQIAEAHNLGPIVRKGDVGTEEYCSLARVGSICKMTQNEAKEYCEKVGSKLPTARELAIFAHALGANGISQTALQGFYLVESFSLVDGAVDSFYYDHTGYSRIESDLPCLWLWSSSVDSKYPDSAQVLSLDHGLLASGLREYDLHVRCVQ